MQAPVFKEPLSKKPSSVPDTLTDDFVPAHILPDDILYPSEDGKPMAASDFQRDPLTYAIDSLKWHFSAQDQVYVTGDLLIYYEKGTSKSVAPDVYVVFDVPKHPRHTYRVWEEGKGPDVVLEILSPTTWQKDVQDNPSLYRDLGVREYFLYDPLDKFIQPALQGYWLDEQKQYQPMRVESLPDGGLKLASHLLGLELQADQTGQFRLFNPQTGKYLSTYNEAIEERLAEAQARQQAEIAQQQAEAERLAETQARQQAEIAQQQAEAERLAEAQARQQAEIAQQEMAQKLREAEEKLKQAGLL